MYFYMLKISLWQSCNLRSGIDRHFTSKSILTMYVCMLCRCGTVLPIVWSVMTFKNCHHADNIESREVNVN